MNQENSNTVALNYRSHLKLGLSAFIFFIDVVGLLGFRFLADLILFSRIQPLMMQNLIQESWIVVLTLITFYIYDLYKVNLQISGLRGPARTYVAVLNILLLLAVLKVFSPFGLRVPLRISLVSLGLYSFWGAFARFFIAQWSRERAIKIRWLVIDNQNLFLSAYSDFIEKHANQNFYCLSDSFDPANYTEDFIHHIGNVKDLDSVKNQPWSGVIIANKSPLNSEQIETLMNMRLQGARVYTLSEFFEHFLYKIPVTHLDHDWFTLTQGFHLLHNPMGLRFKRIVDLLLSTLFLILSSIPMLLIAILTKLTSKGPVFFKQTRVGENEKPFTLYKFRTMTVGSHKGERYTSEKDKRVTFFGRFLRKSRLDELPQLWNVFNGDMSLIGPRAEWIELCDEYEKQIPFYHFRHLIKPGITGWAQVLYPYGASLEDAKQKLEYDLYYIKNYSLFLDIAIVFKTLRVILLGKGR